MPEQPAAGTPGAPVLLYDGGCGFCTRLVRLACTRLSGDWAVAPWQTSDLAALGLSRAEAARSVQWVEPSGRITAGAAAIGRLLLRSGGLAALLGWLVLVPPLSLVTEAVYRLVAWQRRRLPGETPALALPPDQRPAHRRG